MDGVVENCRKGLVISVTATSSTVLCQLVFFRVQVPLTGRQRCKVPPFAVLDYPQVSVALFLLLSSDFLFCFLTCWVALSIVTVHSSTVVHAIVREPILVNKRS